MINNQKKTELDPIRLFFEKKLAGFGLQPLRAMDHPAFAIMETNSAGAEASLRALSRLRREFIDWNEIRVTRTQELARHLSDLPNPETIAFQIKTAYNVFFEKRDCLGFSFLSTYKPMEAKRSLAQAFSLLPKGAQALLLFEYCQGAAFPLSDAALKIVRKDGIAGKNPTRDAVLPVLAAALHLREISLLIQCWEIEASGHPYGPGSKPASPAKPNTKARASGKTGKTGKAAAAGKKMPPNRKKG